MSSNFTIELLKKTKSWENSPTNSTEKTQGRINLFYKSIRTLNIPMLYQYLNQSACESIIDTFLIVFHIRDCRGGKGERSLGRYALTWLFLNYPEKFILVAPLIAEYGRWDDLIILWPKVLNLSNLLIVRNNWSANIPNEKRLNTLRHHQKYFVNIVVEQLKKDYNNMLLGKPISLCAKWCPTEKNSLDRNYNVIETICTELKVTPRIYRKKFISLMRSYLNIVEKLMCNNKWEEINFNQVPSCAMLKLKNVFEKKCPEEFKIWKELLESRKHSTNTKELYPHEIVTKIMFNPCDIVLEQKWNILQREIESLGYLSDVICVCDVSHSMKRWNALKFSFTPLDIAIGLSLIISNSVKGPFHNHIITFHNNPVFHITDDNDSFYKRIINLKNTTSCGNTNLQLTFELILSHAIKHNLKQQNIPKRIFIFSDMDFNRCTEKPYQNEIDYKIIQDEYTKNGYIKPQIVFWNLASPILDFPFLSSQQNDIVLMSGFSRYILRYILKSKDFSPYNTLRQTIDNERYSEVKKTLVPF